VAGNGFTVTTAAFNFDAEQPAAVFTYNVYDALAEGVTLKAVVVCHVLLSMLYDAPPLADAVNVEDCPLQIAVGLAVSDKSVGNTFTVTTAAFDCDAEHPAGVFTYNV
jgi:hypothetical protein